MLIYIKCIDHYRVTLKNVKAWMPRINYKIPTNKLREKFQVSMWKLWTIGV